ncbi:MAG: electron transfer flavoprotein subunit beta/FixA family protein [Desulfohalobiaceae bacterium]
MHIVCCLKQVPDTAEVKIDPETNTLVREGVESILNPYDLVAVEMAVRLKEEHGFRASAVCMGPPQAESVLRQVLSLGIDSGVLLSDRAFAGADTLATSYTLAQAVRALNQELTVDLVLCGKQAIDGDTAQTGPGIATRLGFTQFTYVTGVDLFDPEQKQIRIRRKVEGGQEVLQSQLPALLTVELELAEPRRASLPNLMASLRQPIEVWDKDAIAGEVEKLGIKGSPTWVRRIGAPPPKESGPCFEAADGVSEAVSQGLQALLTDGFMAEELGLESE